MLTQRVLFQVARQNSVKLIKSTNFVLTKVSEQPRYSNISKSSPKNMCSYPNLLKPPEKVKNMEILDKTMFTKPITLPYVNIGRIKVSTILPMLKPYILKIDHYKPVVNMDGITTITLNPLVISKWDDIDEAVRAQLIEKGITHNEFQTKDEELKYENFTVEDVLRSVLPDDKEGSASFTKVGQIVHINLRDHLLPYKRIIGDVLLEKVQGCKTVVNKINNIDNTYRFFEMEVLSGVSDFNVTLKENKCRFEFDFSKVYWNSRLCTEHERIVGVIKDGDVLFDVFAGVGPFSIPAAKKMCQVFANDLNPESYKWLQHNAKINKIKCNLTMFNKDGGDFIKTEVKENLLKYINSREVLIVMNLPALAPEFLKHFRGLYAAHELSEITKPVTVYVYCFAKGEDYKGIARDSINKGFGVDVSDKIIDIFKVRTVSSMKEMMRVSLRLDRDILVGNKRKLESVGETSDENTLQATMGKNKQKQKVINVFKVVGSKSLKPKTKAKPVTVQLKNIKAKTKSKIQAIDKELVNLQDKIRLKKNEPKTGKKKTGTIRKKQTQEEFKSIQEDTKTVLNTLDTMQL